MVTPAEEFERDVINSLGGSEQPQGAKPMPSFKKVDLTSGNTWNPKEKKILEGVFVGTKTVSTKYGDKTVYEIEDTSHNKVGVFESAQLKNGFAKCQPGNIVRITYLGKGFTEKGQPVNNFEFEIAE